MDTQLTIRFERDADAPVCRVTAWRRTGKPFPVSCMGGTGRLPHDLATFVVERELALRGGLVNLTAHGAIFKSGKRRATGPGRALIRAHKADLDAAETIVNSAVEAWRAGRPTPVAAALDEADRAWAALPAGGAIELVWPRLPLPGPARGAHRVALRAERGSPRAS